MCTPTEKNRAPPLAPWWRILVGGGGRNTSLVTRNTHVYRGCVAETVEELRWMEREKEREGGCPLRPKIRSSSEDQRSERIVDFFSFFYEKKGWFWDRTGGDKVVRGWRCAAPPSKKGFQSKYWRAGQKVLLSKLWLAGARQPTPTTLLSRVLDRFG